MQLTQTKEFLSDNDGDNLVDEDLSAEPFGEMLICNQNIIKDQSC